MKTRMFIVAVFVLAVCSVSLAGQSGPRIDFAEKEFNAGEVRQGDIVKHVFEFTNAGDGVLMIQNLTSSWGCTAAMASSAVINPGETGQIDVTLDTKGKMGRLVRVVKVYSNDPESQVSEIHISADIKPPGTAAVNPQGTTQK